MTIAPPDVAAAFVAALNGRDPDAIFDLLADDAEYTTPRGDRVSGSSMVNKMMCASWGTLPDGELVEVRRLRHDNTVVIQARQRGTNAGPIGWAGGAPATCRPVDVDQCHILDIRDDRLTVTEQLGLG
jgi:ketosteroid isomerase-like protein